MYLRSALSSWQQQSRLSGVFARKYKRSPWRHSLGMGDDLPIDTENLPTGDLVLPTLPALPPLPPGTTVFDSPNTQTPQQPGVNPAIAQALTNLQNSAVKSQSPLDYVSPQAAIAAGLPAQTVYNAWSAALAKFPTQQAALAAGIPAGVVTQLWAQSRSATVQAGSFFDGSTFGVSNKILLLGGGAVLLLGAMRGRR